MMIRSKQVQMTLKITKIFVWQSAGKHAVTSVVKWLLDNGATGMFINQEFVHKNELKTWILPFKIKVYNVDGTLNKGGLITEEVTLMTLHKGHKEKAVFEVCDPGKANNNFVKIVLQYNRVLHSTDLKAYFKLIWELISLKDCDRQCGIEVGVWIKLQECIKPCSATKPEFPSSMPPPTKKEILEARRVLLLAEQDEKAAKKKPQKPRKNNKENCTPNALPKKKRTIAVQ